MNFSKKILSSHKSFLNICEFESKICDIAIQNDLRIQRWEDFAHQSKHLEPGVWLIHIHIGMVSSTPGCCSEFWLCAKLCHRKYTLSLLWKTWMESPDLKHLGSKIINANACVYVSFFVCF